MESVNQNEIRNVMLPLAVARPNLYKKLAVISVVVFYIMMVISYLSDSFLTNYIYLEMGIIVLLLLICSKIYDDMYRNYYEDMIDENLTGVVIGFSNKLLILAGEEVVDYYETDKIQIRKVSSEESETFFEKYTSIIECFKDNNLVSRIGIGKLPEYEGIVLTADMSRADEDLEIIEDDEDLDNEDLDDESEE